MRPVGPASEFTNMRGIHGPVDAPGAGLSSCHCWIVVQFDESEPSCGKPGPSLMRAWY